MDFITITQDDVDVKLATALNSRELEIAAYSFEQAAHEQSIAALTASLAGVTWDTSAAQSSAYRNLNRDAMIARALSDGLSEAQILVISDLQSLDFHRLNLLAVKVETAKVTRHYSNLLAQLPEGARRDTALAVAVPALAAKAAAVLQPAQAG